VIERRVVDGAEKIEGKSARAKTEKRHRCTGSRYPVVPAEVREELAKDFD
jgi:hypothetical protein